MNLFRQIELGLTIPLQRQLRIRALPCGQESDRRFCWDLHVISLRGRPSLLAVHCYTRYTFVLYALSHPEWECLPDMFLDGLRRSLSAAGLSAEAAAVWPSAGAHLFTKTHGRREVAFLNRAWEDVTAAELALDESCQHQPLLDQVVNAKPSRCVGFEGLGTAAERLEHWLQSRRS